MGSVRKVMDQITEPVSRVTELPWAGKVLAGLMGVLSWIWADAFLTLLVLLLLAGILDWIYGRTLAHRRLEYDAERARLGWISKSAGLLLLLMVWGMEQWVGVHVGASTGGWVATGLGFALLLSEIDSINGHRMAAGGRPIPGWDRMMEGFDDLVRRMTGPGPKQD